LRGPSDLAEVQGGYSEKIPKGLKLRRGRAIDSESREPSDLQVVSCIVNLGVRRVKVQVLGIASRKDASGERRITVGFGSQEDRWIRAWDRVSGPRKKRFESLATGVARLREGDISTAGGSVGHSGMRVEYRWHEALGVSLREALRHWH
jgi:hypothetical protein